MGKMLRMWRGVWRKNESQYWRFDPEHTDYGLTVYMEEGESFATVERIVKNHYGVGTTTPMVFTYGLPDWMVVPSGHSPPLTIASTTELVELMAARPWMVEFTLLVTVGAKGVAEYHFNRRTPFYIGSSLFGVGDTEDERSKACYERLVFGKRMVTSEKIMNEIFGEEEMVVFYRVAMEMEFADKEKTRYLEEKGGPCTEIIALDDDAEMEDASNSVRRLDSTKGHVHMVPGEKDKGKGICQSSAPQSKAPAVLWDVGIDVGTFPEIYTRDRAAAMEASEKEFWEGVLQEGAKSKDGNVGKDGGGEAIDDDACSTTSNKGGGRGETGTSAEKIIAGGSEEVSPPDLMLTLSCGEGAKAVETNTSMTKEGACEGSENEGGCGIA